MNKLWCWLWLYGFKVPGFRAQGFGGLLQCGADAVKFRMPKRFKASSGAKSSSGPIVEGHLTPFSHSRRSRAAVESIAYRRRLKKRFFEHPWPIGLEFRGFGV